MRLQALQNKLRRRFGGGVSCALSDGVLTLSGRIGSWQDAVAACALSADKKSRYHVVNDIAVDGLAPIPMRTPALRDDALTGDAPDVLIIGGGISGASIARELTRYRLNVLLVDKEPDLAMQASGRNDGEIHPGVDLPYGTLKQKYVLLGNAMMDRVCRELDVPFTRCGQLVGFYSALLWPAAWLFALQRRHIGVKDTRVVGRRWLEKQEPGMNGRFAFAIYNPSAGCVCPYGLTIAYGENAVQNGARASLNTAVTGMTVEKGRIAAVETNRGTLHPRLVINAAGVFAEDVARMAGDRFYSIHPRRGTNSILDKKAGSLIRSIASVKQIKRNKNHTKGGGILHTVHGNLLVGPNAAETFEKENFATDRASVDEVFAKQKRTAPGLTERDIITCFTGVRACTFEEDFIIEPGRKTKNLIHCAGIQSPGLTTAPAVAADVADMAVKLLREERTVEPNPSFNPVRKGVPNLRNLSDAERDRLIRENPDYGVMVCRCEEISKGEIIDALNAPIHAPTLDGIKKRVRPGMGRCQGGFCSPLVLQIIAEHEGVPVEQVKKGYAGADVCFGPTKGALK